MISDGAFTVRILFVRIYPPISITMFQSYNYVNLGYDVRMKLSTVRNVKKDNFIPDSLDSELDTLIPDSAFNTTMAINVNTYIVRRSH